MFISLPSHSQSPGMRLVHSRLPGKSHGAKAFFKVSEWETLAYTVSDCFWKDIMALGQRRSSSHLLFLPRPEQTFPLSRVGVFCLVPKHTHTHKCVCIHTALDSRLWQEPEAQRCLLPRIPSHRHLLQAKTWLLSHSWHLLCAPSRSQLLTSLPHTYNDHIRLPPPSIFLYKLLNMYAYMQYIAYFALLWMCISMRITICVFFWNWLFYSTLWF